MNFDLYSRVSERFLATAAVSLHGICQQTGHQNALLTRLQHGVQHVLLSHTQTCELNVGGAVGWDHPARPPYADDQQPRSLYCYSPQAPASLPVSTFFSVPLRDHQGRLFGHLCVFDTDSGADVQPNAAPNSASDSANDSDYDILPWLEIVARQLSAMFAYEEQHLRSLRSIERASYEAIHDSLTGVYNRRGWDQIIDQETERCGRYHKAAGVIMIDLDNLKLVNDRYGHAAGDELIKRAARVLAQHVRKNDVLARLGGDEFAVLLIEADQQETRAGAERAQRALAGAGIEASIGAATRSVAEPGDDLSTVIRAADARMYDIKNNKRQRLLRLAGERVDAPVDEAGAAVDRASVDQRAAVPLEVSDTTDGTGITDTTDGTDTIDWLAETATGDRCSPLPARSAA